MNYSDYLFSQLVKIGIEDIFLLPGGGCMYLVDAISRNSSLKPRVLLHEQSVGIAAEAYAQYRNSISVVLVTTGPGGTNAITPCAAAWTDSTPMLFISGQVKTLDSHELYGVRQFGFQEIPITEIVKPITKKAIKLKSSDDLSFELLKLIRIATEGRPGPVWLDIPLDLQNINFDISNDKSDVFKNNSHDAVSLSTDTEGSNFEIREIINSLHQAKKPLLLLGNGVRLSNSIDDAILFANKLMIPILLTWKTIDFLGENDPLNVGRPGSIPQPWSNLLQEEADFILSIGARIDTGQSAYNLQNFGKMARKFIVDIDKNELNKFPLNETFKVLNLDAKFFFKQLSTLDISKLNSGLWEKWRIHIAETKSERSPSFFSRIAPKRGVNLYNFINSMSVCLSDDAILVPGSSGACSEIVMQAFKVKKGQRVLNSEGLGSMGFGISAAYGVSLASGSRQIVCIDGDGGFQMNIQELATVQLNVKGIKFFVLNNNGYGSIKLTQDKYFNGRRVGTDPSSGLALVNLEKIAASFSMKFFRIESEDNLLDSIRIALSDESNAIIEVLVDPNQVISPRVVSRRDHEGNFIPADMSIMQY